MNDAIPPRAQDISRGLSPRSRIRSLLASDEMVVVPGGFSPVYAAMAERVGFKAFFVAGSQVSAFLYGVPDVGIMGLRDMVDHVRHVQARVGIPVIADADTGYGNAINVYYATREFVRSGVAAMQIEDQVAPKKSGTSAGRECVPIEEAVGKIRAAVNARNELDRDFVVVARCDAIGAKGGSEENATERCVRYAAEGGADVVWLNSVQSLEHLSEVCDKVEKPVMTIWGGPKPAPSLDEFRATGVRLVLYPVIAASAGMQASWQVLNEFAQSGSVALEAWGSRVQAQSAGKVELKSLVFRGEELRDLESQYIPETLQRDYGSTFGHSDMSFGHVTPPGVETAED